jgi:hypothetical protein
MAATIRPFQFTSASYSIASYLADVSRGAYDLDPRFQRNMTKSPMWQIKMISHIIWTRLPCTLSFHPKVKKTASGERMTVYECVDGKSRSNALRNFMNDAFAPKDCGYAHLNGVLFSKWPLADKDSFMRISLTVATSNRTLSHDEINRLFNNLKTPSYFTTGESLNGELSSPLRKMVMARMKERPEFRKLVNSLWGKNEKFQYMEMIARLAYMTAFPDETRHTDADDMHLIWTRGISAELFDTMAANMQKVVDMTKEARIVKLSSATVFCPFFKLFVMNTPQQTISKIAENLDSRPFKDRAGGGTDATIKRYRILLELGA